MEYRPRKIQYLDIHSLLYCRLLIDSDILHARSANLINNESVYRQAP